MTDMTPVAWMYSDDNRGGTGVISFDRVTHYKNEVPLYTAEQLRQAKADALREAADRMPVVGAHTWLRRMAEEMK